MGNEMTNNGWSEYENLVLAELKRLNATVLCMDEKNDKEHKEIRETIAKDKESTQKEINDHKVEAATKMTEVKSEIKYKSGLTGALVAFLTTLTGLLVYFFLIQPPGP